MNIIRRYLSRQQQLLLIREPSSVFNAVPIYLRRNLRGNRGGRSAAGDQETDPEEPKMYGAPEDTERAPEGLASAPGDLGRSPQDLARAPEVNPELQQRRNRSVKKNLHHSATFQETSPQAPQFSDPFISGPYPTGTKVPNEVRKEAKEDDEETVVKIDPKKRTVIQFPGDGTQYLRMCGNPSRFPAHIETLYKIASGVMGLDLVDLMMNGPAEKLDKPRYSQPAILVSSLAALELLRDFDPQAVENCAVTAGFGIGEVASLVLAGVLSFEDAVKFAKYRGEAVQLAGEIVPGGMSVVFYGADSQLGLATKYAEEWCRRQYRIEHPVCSIANYLFPHCKIIAGNVQALEFIELNYKDFKLRKVKRLPTKTALNCQLMAAAAEPMKAFLESVRLNPSRITVYSNVTGNTFYNERQVRSGLVKQVYLPVKWEQILHAIYARSQNESFPHTFECGPGRSLGQVFQMVNRKAHQFFNSISPDFQLSQRVQKMKQQ